ncbi:hypothetical protein IMCC20628_01800 [Hoeflea sp. IMCC20628]|uniref:beta strand repeat-containing protein n=1 Tax=Hoeflea sp. IMCC20628 TaxID=1620421 RepID=UPI00063A8F33|nr:hypothetical protein [Hoeflea sp. IMCC20628]AKI00510.1 hypothetical protein IMCC20628_01800 [Hoeflea sp. IMCC20628]
MAGTLTNSSPGAAVGGVGGVDIAAGGILTTTALANNAGGEVTNAGTIDGDLSNAGTTTNSGSVTGTLMVSGGLFDQNTGGSVAGATTITGGTVTNAGTLAAVDNQASFTNEAGGVAGAVTNSGTGSNAGTIASLANSGTFSNTATISGDASNTAGTTTNTGSVGGTLTVSGGLFDQNTGGSVAGATTITGGTVTNAGTLAAVDNQASFTNEAGGVAGAVTNSGTGSNAGTIASLANSGTFSNTATISGDASNTAGTTTNTGSVGGTLTVSGGLFDQNTGGSVAGATTITGGTVTNAGTLASVNNQASFTNEAGGTAGAVTNSGTGSNAGTIASVSNANIFANMNNITGVFTQSAGTMTNTGTIGGLATVDGGTFDNNGGTLNGGLTNNAIFNSNGGTLIGTVNPIINNATFNQAGTTAATGVFNNTGTFNMNGSALNGFSAFNNTGTVNALGASTLGGPVNNTGGTVSLLDGATDDVLTVNGNVTNGGGGTYNFDLALTNAATGLVDTMVIDGSLAGTIDVNFTPIVVSSRDTPGDTTVITTTGNGGSNIGTVTGLVSGPFVQYNLVDSGNNYVIRTTLNLGTLGGLVGSLSSVQNIVNSAINRPTSAFVATPIGVEPDTCSPGVYGRMTAGTSTATSTTSSPLSASASTEVDVNYGGFQGGADWGCFNIGGDGASVNLGVLGGVSLGTANQNQNLITSSNRFTSRNIGAYATYSKGRFFADIQTMFDWTRFEINSMANGQVFVQDDSFDTRRFTVSGSMGYAFSFDDVSVVPTTGFSYSRTSADNVTIDASPGGTLQFDDVENIIGFASLTVAKTYILPNETSALQPFVTASIYNDFGEDPSVNYIAPSLAVTPTSTTNFGTYGEFSAGVNYRNILDAENGSLREVSASIRGDVTFNENLLGGRITANLRLQF